MSDGVKVTTVQEATTAHDSALGNAAAHIQEAGRLLAAVEFGYRSGSGPHPTPAQVDRANAHVALAEAIMLGVWVEHQIHDGMLAP